MGRKAPRQLLMESGRWQWPASIICALVRRKSDTSCERRLWPLADSLLTAAPANYWDATISLVLSTIEQFPHFRSEAFKGERLRD